MFGFTESCWQHIREKICSVAGLPAWTQPVLACSYNDLVGGYEVLLHSKQILNSRIQPDDITLYLGYLTIQQDYLDWLKEQIELAPRGPEWNRVLEARLKAYEPYTGIEIIRVYIGRESESVVLWISKDRSRAAIHYEVY